MTWGNIFINANQGISLRERRSKKILRALRHSPYDYKIELDEKGFVDLSELAKGVKFSEADLKEIVELDSRRFELSTDSTKVRATYGHTCQLVELPKRSPPNQLWAVVNRLNADRIKIEGLKPEKGFYFKLYTNPPYNYGRYAGPNVPIKSGTAKKEVDFYYLATTDTWYARHIPAKYIDIGYIN